MYLEISPRQSGKTTRLIEEVKNHLEKNENNKAMVFACNHQMANYIAQRIRQFHTMPNKWESDRIRITTPTAGHICSWDLSRYKLFFDEFDYFNVLEFKEFFQCLDKSQIYNAYFCTTPLKMRTLKQMVDRKTDDIFIKLLRKNKHNYKFYPMYSAQRKTKIYNELGSANYLTQAEGLFIK